jgi:hypothetical protein
VRVIKELSLGMQMRMIVLSTFKINGKPKNWSQRHRFIFIYLKVKRPFKGVLQLNIFEPLKIGQDHNPMVTNKKDDAATTLDFHHGRGAQKILFAELKSHNQQDYIPCKHWHGNQTYGQSKEFTRYLEGLTQAA